MRPHPRIRKTIKWGGLAATVVLVVVWIGSEWLGLEYSTSRWTTSFLHGRLGVMRWVSDAAGLRSVGWRTYATGSSEWEWWYEPVQFVHVTGVKVPGWWLALAVGVPTAVAWRLDIRASRRARLNLCPTCQYDRAGLAPGAACPECGGAAPKVV